MDIEYRRLLPTESLIYRYIRLECLKDFPEAFGTKYENAILQEKTGFQLSIENSDELKFVVGAFDDKIIIGICAFERNNMLGNIYQMYVKPKYSGQKIGYQLLLKTIEEIHKLDNDIEIYLEVKINNIRAKKLYEKIGFKMIECIDDEYKMKYNNL
jgi:ribosomal protein S18 acetylase RimI-like enzyme